MKTLTKVIAFCLLVIIAQHSFLRDASSSSKIVAKYLNEAGKHFDTSVNKFVDLTNKHILGVEVDSRTRQIQVTAVKMMIDPRPEATEKYLNSLEKDVAGLFTGNYSPKVSSGSKSNPNICLNHFKQFSQLQNQYRKATTPLERIEINFAIEKLPCDILECYIEHKQYNLALNWAKDCNRLGLVNNMCQANRGRFFHFQDKLEMIVKGGDNW